MKKYSCLAADPSRAIRLFGGDAHKSKVRDAFQIDRDRILYSKAFRRLRGKTQVFIAGYDDHVRNRLSHTLEVCQIARTISSALGLNDALTEAIALGHDLGHTPFGHVGERTLNNITMGTYAMYVDGDHYKPLQDGFKHNWQSVRVACNLEFHNRDYPGLNLTRETLWGFLHHSKLECSEGLPSFYTKAYENLLSNEECWSFEGIVVNLADEIAQRHHDIEDGLITGILEKKGLISYLDKMYKNVALKQTEALRALLKKADGEVYPEFYYATLAHAIVDFYVSVVVEKTQKLFGKLVQKYKLKKDSFYKKKRDIWQQDIVSEKAFVRKMMSESLHEIDDELQKKYFMQRILLSHQAQKNDGKAEYLIRRIVSAYLGNPQQMPDNAIMMFFVNCESRGDFKKLPEAMKTVFSSKDRADRIGQWREKLDSQLKNGKGGYPKKLFNDSLLRTVIDYVAGMTDDYAIAIYEQLYGGTKHNRY